MIRAIQFSYVSFLWLWLSPAGSAVVPANRNRGPSAPEIFTMSLYSRYSGPTPRFAGSSGTVRAAQTSQLASQMMGNIVEIRVHEGDRVRRGQVLAVIDDAQPRAAVDRATAAENAAGQEVAASDSDLALAQSTLKRYQTLYDRKSVSPQEFDEVKARYQAALAHRDMTHAGQAQAKAALAQAHTSFSLHADSSRLLMESSPRRKPIRACWPARLPIFTIEGLGHYRLEATVNENDLRYVRMGQQVPVVVDALQNPELKGKVMQIVPAADPAAAAFLVKIELPVGYTTAFRPVWPGTIFPRRSVGIAHSADCGR